MPVILLFSIFVIIFVYTCDFCQIHIFTYYYLMLILIMCFVLLNSVELRTKTFVYFVVALFIEYAQLYLQQPIRISKDGKMEQNLMDYQTESYR